MQTRASHIINDADYKLALLHLIYAWLACSSAWWLFTSLCIPEANLVRSASALSIFTATTLFALAQYGSQRLAGLSFIAIMFSASIASILLKGFHTLMPGLIFPALLAIVLFYDTNHTKRIALILMGLFFIVLALHSVLTFLKPQNHSALLVSNPLIYTSVNGFNFAFIALTTAIIGWHLSRQVNKTLIQEENTLEQIQQEVAGQQESLRSIYRHLNRDVLVLNAQQHIVCISAQLLAKLRLREDEILNTPAAHWFTDDQDRANDFTLRSNRIRFKPNPLLRNILWQPLESESKATYRSCLVELSFPVSAAHNNDNSLSFELDSNLGLALFQKQIEQATQTLQEVDFIVCRFVKSNTLISTLGVNPVRGIMREACLNLYQTLKCETILIDAHTIVLRPSTETSRTAHRAHHYLNASTPNIDTADSEWLISHVIAPIDGSNINDLLQMHDSNDSQLTIRTARRRVLRHIRARDFVVHFQSIANLSDTSKILFYEALARWVGKNPMSPPEFLAHAFAMGLGNRMTLLLFDTFCQALEQTIRKTPNLSSKFSFNIHLSVFVDQTMRQALVDIVHQYNLKPSSIIFELIELENTTRFEELNDAIRHYEALGFSVAIDDFGSSFSSIQRLASFMFGYLKLDASITHALRDTNIQIVIRNLAELAADWGVPLIAEGIETKEQKARLENLGVHWGQGYLMSRPAPMHSGKRGAAL